MRKALIGLILAATAMTPVAAWAQNDDNPRAERIRARNEARSERQQVRVERQQAPRAEAQRSDVARERSGGQWGDRQRSDVARERNRGQWGEQQRNRAVEQQVVQRRSGGWDRDRDRDVGERSSAYPSAWQGDPNDPRRQRYEDLERRNQYRYGTHEQREQVRQEVRREGGWDGRRDGRRGDWRDRDGRRDDWRDGRRSRTDWSRNWDRNHWRSDRRYDWRRWRYANRSLFRLSPYYSPYRNWGYSRFSIGVFLEPLFYSNRYWIGDPYQYRLPYAPPGTQWIRYYNDVLLVDVYSGEVIDVIYDFFW